MTILQNEIQYFSVTFELSTLRSEKFNCLLAVIFGLNVIRESLVFSRGHFVCFTKKRNNISKLLSFICYNTNVQNWAFEKCVFVRRISKFETSNVLLFQRFFATYHFLQTFQ